MNFARRERFLKVLRSKLVESDLSKSDKLKMKMGFAFADRYLRDIPDEAIPVILKYLTDFKVYLETGKVSDGLQEILTAANSAQLPEGFELPFQLDQNSILKLMADSKTRLIIDSMIEALSEPKPIA